MGTPLQTVYDAFLAKMLDDEWVLWEQERAEQDWKEILLAAIPNFKFPRVSLDINPDPEVQTITDDLTGETIAVYTPVFSESLSNEEVQIIATYMKCEWLNREILTWERIKPLYEERDFSEANMLSKLYDALEAERKRALRLESIYYRSIRYNPWDYTKLAGDQ